MMSVHRCAGSTDAAVAARAPKGALGRLATALVMALAAVAVFNTELWAATDLIDQYKVLIGGWRTRALTAAVPLFGAFAVLELVISAYGWSSDEQVGIDTIFKRLAMKVLQLSLIGYLLLNPGMFIDKVITGIIAGGALVTGHTNVLDPSDLLLEGTKMSVELFDAVSGGVPSSSGGWIEGILTTMRLIEFLVFNIFQLLLVFIAALVFVIAFAIIAGQLVLATIRMYIVVNIGLFFLGFASFRGTAGFAESYVKYSLQSAVHLFFLNAMVGVGQGLISVWKTDLSNAWYFVTSPGSPTTCDSLAVGCSIYVEFHEMILLICAVVLYTFITMKIPAELAGRFMGEFRLGIADTVKGR